MEDQWGPGFVVAKPFRFKDHGSLPRRQKKKNKRRRVVQEAAGSGRTVGMFVEVDGDGTSGGFYSDGDADGDYDIHDNKSTRKTGDKSNNSRVEVDEVAAVQEGGNGDKEEKEEIREGRESEREGEGEGDSDEAFAEMVNDALDTEEGGLVWERVFGESILRFAKRKGIRVPAFGGGGDDDVGRREFVGRVMEGMYEGSFSSSSKPFDGFSSVGEGLEEDEEEEEEGESEKTKERNRHKYKDENKEKENDKEVRDRRKAKEDAEIMARIQKLVDEEEERKRERERWKRYLGLWREWDGKVEGIPWPVWSMRRRPTRTAVVEEPEDRVEGAGAGAGAGGVEANEVREWFLDDWENGRIGKEEFVARLKGERVRWHPDRFNRRFGGQKCVDPGLGRDVTVVFQVLGGLWEDVRGAGGAGCEEEGLRRGKRR